MKKALLLTLVLTLLTALIPAAQADSGLPTVDKALKGKQKGRIEVVNELDKYLYTNPGEFEMKGLKCIILERVWPEPAFEMSDVSFADGTFVPKDTGPAKVYLRKDWMEALPKQMRATSMKEASFLVVAENIYRLEQQIIHTEYKDAGAESIPESITTVEEMAEYLAEHPKEPDRITYKTLYTAYAMVGLYDREDGTWISYDSDRKQSPIQCKNREAGDKWASMQDALILSKILRTKEGRPSVKELSAMLETLIWLDETNAKKIGDQITAKKYTKAADALDKVFWSMAKELQKLDKDKEAQSWYKKLLKEKDPDALALYANLRDYYAITTPDEEIIRDKLYFGPYDPARLEELTLELIEEFKGVV